MSRNASPEVRALRDIPKDGCGGDYRNTATKAALYLSKNNHSNFGKYTLSTRNRLHKQKYCHFETVT